MSNRPPRVPFVRALSVSPAEGDSPERLLASNLSRGGIYVTTDRPPAEGTHVVLELAAAGRFLEFAEGDVAWVRPKRGFGVRFTRLKPNAQALVEHLVARGGTGSERRRRMLPYTLALALAVGAGAAFLHPMPKAAPPMAVASMSVAPEAPPPKPVDLTAHAFPGEFQFSLPTGAVSSLRVTINDTELAVMPTLKKGAQVTRIFDLTHPARLVIDVSGRQPKYSWQLEGTQVVKSVRVGARNHGTRVVVDLPELPADKHYRLVLPTS